jgi:hypothetical protein
MIFASIFIECCFHHYSIQAIQLANRDLSPINGAPSEVALAGGGLEAAEAP